MHVPTRYLPHAVAAVGAASLLTWATGVQWFATLGGVSAAMMPTTGIGMFVAATAIYHEPDRTNVARIGTLGLWLSCALNAVAPWFGDDQTGPFVDKPGTMSTATTIVFLALSLWGIARSFTWGEKLRAPLGLQLVLVGSVALAGYVLGEPALFYYSVVKSNGMAVLTAAFFVMLGLRLTFPPRAKS